MNRVKKLLCGICIAAIAVVSVQPMKAGAAEEQVMASEETKEINPRLIIESYEIASGTFERSAQCTLRIKVSNIDEKETAMAGVIAMYSSYVFPVFGKTNQIMLGDVEPGESVYVDFEVNLDKIVSGPNPIEFVLGWSDREFVPFSNTVHISPVLLEKVEFEVSAIRVPDTVYGSKNTTLSVSYENTGAENLQNVYLVLEGDLAQGVQVVELEDISAKQKEMIEYSIELLNMGENRIRVSFKYEDRNGTEYTTEAIENVVTVTEKKYVSPTPQKKDVKVLLKEYRVFAGCAVLALLLCIPFLISLLRRGGKKR